MTMLHDEVSAMQLVPEKVSTTQLAPEEVSATQLVAAAGIEVAANAVFLTLKHLKP
jgi:hypothetical protein